MCVEYWINTRACTLWTCGSQPARLQGFTIIYSVAVFVDNLSEDVGNL